MPVQPHSAAQVHLADVELFTSGRNFRLWELLGAFPELGGTRFVVWAPNASFVGVAGDWNSWYGPSSPLFPQGGGVWAGFAGGVGAGMPYKYEIYGPNGERWLRADPMARQCESPPASASVVGGDTYRWGDSAWLGNRSLVSFDRLPLRIYEVHLGTWRPLIRDYRTLATELSKYVMQMGFTHVELRPVMEHAATGWGSEFFGFYAPTARYGHPDDFRYFVDVMHQSGIGVILAWSPANVPTEEWALTNFDGAPIYENPPTDDGWPSLGFNLGKPEVRSFLISSALSWLSQFHVDGIRVEAVSKVLFDSGDSTVGVGFLRDLTTAVADAYPGALVIAEESTAWPGLTAPPANGGLGFTHRWNTGWMNKAIEYFSLPDESRRLHAGLLPSSLQPALAERSILPLPQSESLLDTGSVVTRLDGDEVTQFANLRALLAWMWAFPGGKLLTAGTEFGAVGQQATDTPLDWSVRERPGNSGVSSQITLMNRLATIAESLWELDNDEAGFQWLDQGDADQSLFAFIRWGAERSQAVACLANLSTATIQGYRVGLPWTGSWSVLLNTDSTRFWGVGQERFTTVMAHPSPWQNLPASALLTVAPMTVLWIGSGR